MGYNKFMIEVHRTEDFSRWLRRLRDANAVARIVFRIRRLELGNDNVTYTRRHVREIGDSRAGQMKCRALLKRSSFRGARIIPTIRLPCELFGMSGDRSHNGKAVRRKESRNRHYWTWLCRAPTRTCCLQRKDLSCRI
jgi:hypothetical protein